MLSSAFFVSLLLAVAAAFIGGILAKKFKLAPIVGYIVSGIFLGVFLSKETDVAKLAELGIVLLLFSLGLEFPLKKIVKIFKSVFWAVIVQAVLVTLLTFLFLIKTGFPQIPSLIIAFGIFCSSTAVVVKTLSDRGETETVHGEIMIGWLLIQDLLVIPAVVLLTSFAGGGASWPVIFGTAVLKAFYVVVTTLILGRLAISFLIHRVAAFNSRELLLLASFALATGVAYLTYLLGISPALGAFLAGLVLADSAESHAIFAETRPLRDIFVAVFFVTLGFMVRPEILFGNFGKIFVLAAFIILVKTVCNLVIAAAFGLRGKTVVAVSLGLSQVGEFSFVIFSLAASLKLLRLEDVSVVVASVLITLVATPFLFRSIIPVWRRLKKITAGYPRLHRYFATGEEQRPENTPFQNHIIICGYGRVGGWVGRALDEIKVPFVIVEYSQEIVSFLKKRGYPVIYGDPGEEEVLEAAGIRLAKAVVLAIPDRISQEMLISHVQSVAPGLKIISRVHRDEDWARLKLMKIHKVVQPEFEAAVAIVRILLTEMGKSKEEIASRVKSLRISRSLK